MCPATTTFQRNNSLYLGTQKYGPFSIHCLHRQPLSFSLPRNKSLKKSKNIFSLLTSGLQWQKQTGLGILDEYKTENLYKNPPSINVTFKSLKKKNDMP